MHREDDLRARQFELEQQLANAEEYNDNLHEEVHQLHNQLHPYVLPGVAEMDSEEDEPVIPAEEHGSEGSAMSEVENGHNDHSDHDE